MFRPLSEFFRQLPRLSACWVLLFILSGLPGAWANSPDMPDMGLSPVEKTVSLRLKWFHAFQFAGFYAAVEKGFYAEEGLNVHLLERDPETSVVDDVVSGRVDFGVADASLIVARMNGQPVVMLNPIFQHSPMVLMSLAEKNILSPGDLLGKKVMYQLDEDDAVIVAMLNEAGLAQNDIVSVPHSFDDWALLNADIDAVSAYLSDQPFQYREKGVNINIIDPANYGIDFYGDSLFTREALIKQQPEMVAAFRRASLKGWDYAVRNPQEIVELLLRKGNTGKTREELEYEARVTRRMLQADLIDVGMINHHRLDRIADIYRERGRVPKDANLHGFFADDYLQQETAPVKLLSWLVTLAGVCLAGLALLFVVNQRLQKRVSQKTRDADEARKKLEHYLSILDRHTCVLRVNANLQVQFASAAFCELTGYANTQLLGKLHDSVLMESDNGPRMRQMMETIALGQNWQGEMFLQCKNGEQRVMEVSAEPVLGSEGKFDGYNAIFQDMTQRKNAERLSITDSLTGLYNRNKLDELLYKEGKLVNRGSPVFSVVLLDIDHFKNVNDEHGHLVGDQVLKEFARTLKSNIRETDQAGRWGGEEFMVICPNTSLMGAEKLSEMLRATMERAEYPEHIRVTSSFGVAEYFPGESIDNLVKRADEGLYWAKNSGRNCVRARPCHVGSA